MNSKHLTENKDHLINKLALTDTEKEEIKAFFAKHPSYENRIDWNNKNLTYDDFKSLLALDGKSKTQAKHKGIEGLVEGVDYKYWGEFSHEKLGDYKVYQPLTYLGSQTLASNKVPPVKDNGAKWCIAYQKSSKYWDDYTGRGVKFFFIHTAITKYAITIYRANIIEVYSFEDRCLSSSQASTFKHLSFLQDTLRDNIFKVYVSRALRHDWLIENEDGTYNIKVGEKGTKFELDDFVLDGKLAIQFKNCNRSFDIRGTGLTSLQGCPEIVKGNFDCSFNNLTSLKGAPRRVGKNFLCSNNKLKTLEGGPEKVGGNYFCSFNELKNLKGSPKKVKGDFLCFRNLLTSLEGGPEYVKGSYEARLNNLTTLKGAPSHVEGDFECFSMKLTSLEGAPNYVGGDFDCGRNQITSLEGAPEEVGGSFNCAYNKLTSLKGTLKKVGGQLDCSNNEITTLKGEVESVGWSIKCMHNPLVSLEGAPQTGKGGIWCVDTPVDRARYK